MTSRQYAEHGVSIESWGYRYFVSPRKVDEGPVVAVHRVDVGWPAYMWTGGKVVQWDGAAEWDGAISCPEALEWLLAGYTLFNDIRPILPYRLRWSGVIVNVGLALMLFLALDVGMRRIVATHRVRRGRCSYCGYDNPSGGRCPECGLNQRQ